MELLLTLCFGVLLCGSATELRSGGWVAYRYSESKYGDVFDAGSHLQGSGSVDWCSILVTTDR